MADDVTEYPTQRIRLQPCQLCGRNFNVEILSKHQGICRKVSNRKRKVFDAGKQRATGSDVPYKATKRTAQIYNGEVAAQDERTKYPVKSNWRAKHRQLIQSIREARSVTQAMKQGGPLPAFRPSEVPSDYVNCPYCHRNFNQHAAARHIPFCQSQHGRKQTQNTRPNQQTNRARTLPPPQHSASYRQQPSYSTSAYSNSHDPYTNGYKHTNSAPMNARRNPSEYQQAPLPPPPRKKESNGWSIRKMFGFDSKENTNATSNYYDDDHGNYYESSDRRPVKHEPVLMRTGRTQENTTLNTYARHRYDEVGSYARRIPPPQSGPSNYGQSRYQNGNNQYNSMRPTAVGRPLPSTYARCGECGSVFTNMSSRYCVECGSRR